MAAPAPPPSGASADKAQGGAKSNKMMKLIALGFIAAVIGGECLAAVLFLASAGEEAPAKPTAVKADASSATNDSSDSPGDDETQDEAAPAAEKPELPDPKDRGLPAGPASAGDHEVDLGQFSLTVYQPTAGTTLLVDFHLYGTIRSKDESVFSERLEKHKHRIRDQVIVTIRSAEIADFADPGLGLIKRQVLEKSNTLLGKRLLRSIMFSDFTFIEQ